MALCVLLEHGNMSCFNLWGWGSGVKVLCPSFPSTYRSGKIFLLHSVTSSQHWIWLCHGKSAATSVGNYIGALSIELFLYVLSVFWDKLGKNTVRTSHFICIPRLMSKDFWKVLPYDLSFFLLCFTSSPLLIRLAGDFFILFVLLKWLIFLLFLIFWFPNFQCLKILPSFCCLLII